jgi:integrase
MLAQAGLPKIRFHDLRESACSLLLATGVSIVVASGRGGDLAATPRFCGTTSTLQIRKKKN